MKRSICFSIGFTAVLAFSLCVSAPAVAAVRPQTIAELETLDTPELDRLFVSGRVPNLESMEGRLAGRAILPRDEEGFCSPCAAFARTLFQSPLILWAGKVFERTPDAGWEGRNLFFSAARGHAAYKMRPQVGRSKISGRAVLRLDYKISGNPPIINRVFDELVEVRQASGSAKPTFASSKAERKN